MGRLRVLRVSWVATNSNYNKAMRTLRRTPGQTPRQAAWLTASTALLTLLLGGCEHPEPSPTPASSAAVPPASLAPVPQPPAADLPVIVFLGDSLTAGYGLDEDEAFPALLDELLRQEGQPVRVVNAGVSGDTTAGGLERLDWLLRQAPDVLFVCLGANDGLRGLPLATSEANLQQILRRAQSAGVQVILAGMQVPPNYGPEYAAQFAAIYPRLARQFPVTFVEFLLTGVAAVPDLNLADGIHPNAEGQRRVAKHLLPTFRQVLAQVSATPR